MSFEFITPPIPERIKALRCAGYKNIFEYDLGNKNLFGTETLCGDWGGDLLIVAKDFAPTRVIKKRKDQHDQHPYRHSPDNPTNKLLAKLLSENRRSVFIDGRHNTSCGVLYMSACFFLRDDGLMTGALPNQSECIANSRPVFEFTIWNMPKLKKIACLGDFAFVFVTDFFCITPQPRWRDCLDSGQPIEARGYSIYAHSHTGRLGRANRLRNARPEQKKEAILDDWRRMLNSS